MGFETKTPPKNSAGLVIIQGPKLSVILWYLSYINFQASWNHIIWRRFISQIEVLTNHLKRKGINHVRKWKDYRPNPTTFFNAGINARGSLLFFILFLLFKESIENSVHLKKANKQWLGSIKLYLINNRLSNRTWSTVKTASSHAYGLKFPKLVDQSLTNWNVDHPKCESILSRLSCK